MSKSRFRDVCRLGFAAALCATALLAPLAAQQPPAPEGFVPMSEVTNREVLPATPLVFYAYGFVWVALMGYLWSIWRRMARVEQDLDAVRRRIGDGQRR